MLPNFIIAGATRSGTTSLYNYLIQHPEIEFPKLKEPRYFSCIELKLPQKGPGDETVDKKLILTLQEYEKLYNGIRGYPRIGDASSEYLYHYDPAAEHIRKILGDVPIIISLRNPIDRAYSAFNNLVRDGRETENFDNALKLEEKRISENWDMMWHYKNVGLYFKQVRKYMELFSNVKILIFEEFINNKSYWIEDVLKFLNVSTNVELDVSTAYSHSGKPRNKLFSLLMNRRLKYIYPIREAIIRRAPRKVLESISKKLLVKDEINPSTRKYLLDYFKEDICSLEDLLGMNLHLWK